MSSIEMSKFMKSLVEQMESKGLSDKTIKMYLQRLYIINGKKKFTSLVFLRDTSSIIDYLKQNLSPSTQKSYSGTIISVLKLKPTKWTEKVIPIYNSFISDEDIKEINQPKMSEKQKDNMISVEEINKIKNDLEKEASRISRKPKVDNKKDYDVLLRNLLLSFYTSIPPRRTSDYALMKFGNDKNDDFNYFTDDDKLVFNNYKTKKTYGKQIIDVSKNKQLLKDFRMYMKHRRPNAEDFLLVRWKGMKFNTINDVTRELNSIFGKNISASMLRNIYVKDKYGEIKQGMIEDSEKMGHSVKTQQTHYNKD